MEGKRRALVALAATALIASACSTTPSAQPPGTTPQATDLGATTQAPTPATSPGQTTVVTEPPAPVISPDQPFALAALDRDQLFAEWAAQRAAAVERIREAGWGVGDDRILRGPGGLELDLGSCPGDWSDEGPAGETVELLWWTSFDLGPRHTSAQLYIDWLDDEARIADGRPIEVTSAFLDPWDPHDRMTPGEIETREEELAGRLDEFAGRALVAVGPALPRNSFGVADHIDGACLPTLAPFHSHARTPGTNPWLGPTPTIDPAVEAATWVDAAAETHPGARMAVIAIDDFGDSYTDSVARRSAEIGTDIDWEVFEHDNAGTDLDRAIDSALALRPERVHLATVGALCLEAAEAIRAADPAIEIVYPSHCRAIDTWVTPLAAEGHGLRVFLAEGASAEFPLHSSAPDRAAEDGVEDDPYNDRADVLWLATWHAVEVVKIAAELPGGLTRSNVLIAAWSFEGRHPYASATVAASWPDDHRLMDRPVEFAYDADIERWVLVGTSNASRVHTRDLDRDELLARWTTEREAMLRRIDDRGWRKEGDLLHGPWDEPLDLSRCPPNWVDGDPTGEGQVVWWSSAYHDSTDASAQAFLEWLGSTAPVGDGEIRLHGVLSEPVNPDFTDGRLMVDSLGGPLDATLELAELGIAIAGFGLSDTTGVALSQFDETCLPSMGIRSLVQRPTGEHPWSIPWPNHHMQTDGTLLGIAADRLAGDKRVALLAPTVEWFDPAVAAVTRAVGADRLEIIRWNSGDPVAPLTSVRDAAVIAVLGQGDLCTFALQEIRDLTTSPIVSSQICRSSETSFGQAGPEVDDVYRVVSFYDADDQQLRDTPLAADANAIPDEPQIGEIDDHWVHTWQAVQILKVAAELPGGLTRSNIVLAGWAFGGTHPFLEGGAVSDWSDPSAVRVGRVHEWDLDAGVWRPTDELVYTETRP